MSVLNPLLCQLKWEEILTPPCGSGMERVYLTHVMSAEMEIGTYPTLWQ